MTRFFFNYNTVEAALLAAAILVNLAGIMFQTGRFDTTAAQVQKEVRSGWHRRHATVSRWLAALSLVGGIVACWRHCRWLAALALVGGIGAGWRHCHWSATFICALCVRGAVGAEWMCV